MEIKANYVLIGAFTILGILGALGFFVWLASFQIDRRFELYDIYFEDVSGLSRSAEVRYNGLPVGQVLSLDIAPGDPRIRVRIEVGSDTPIRRGTTAQLAIQGVTGVAYVSLSGGEADAPLLGDVSDQEVPVIPSRPSLVQTLTETAPDIVSETIDLLERLQEFAGPENQERVATLLDNLAQSSGALDQALADFSQISQTVSAATGEISAFTDRLDTIGGAVETTLGRLDETLATSRSAISEAERTFIAATDAFEAAESTVGVVGETIENEVPRISGDLSAAIRSVDVAIADAMEELGSVTARFGSTADLADARLSELEGTLAAIETTLADAQESLDAVFNASEAFETLVEGTGASLVDEARLTLATVDDAMTTLNETIVADAPQIAADIRAATAGANRAIAQAEEAIAALPDRLDPLVRTATSTLETATGTLNRAEETLARIDGALATAESALESADRAFGAAADVIDTEAGPAAADIREAARSVETAMAALAEDLPSVAEDLRQTAARARQVAETIAEATSAAAPNVNAFAERGLPQFTRFARDAQDLVEQLQRLVERIERDPTRFFFGTSRPEFSR